MIWPEKLYQFTKVQGAIKTWEFWFVDKGDPLYAFYRNNYCQSRQLHYTNVKDYHTSLEACYIAWIELIEKFKQKIIKQFENKCGIQYKSRTEQRLDDFLKEHWPDDSRSDSK